MRETMRRRSFCGKDSRSFTADDRIWILYLATTPQTLDDVLELQVRLARPFIKSSQVFSIFGQAQTHGPIHQIRNALVNFGAVIVVAGKRGVNIHQVLIILSCIFVGAHTLQSTIFMVSSTY